MAKYTIKETKSEKRINPDTIPEFKNKVDAGNGLTIYTVEDSEAGLRAVRRIIDTHWGEKANPWCLARRMTEEETEEYRADVEEMAADWDGTLPADVNDLSDAWAMWNSYDVADKRIAFKDGKLLAFCASDRYDTEWWDREDEPSEKLMYSVKRNGDTITYAFDKETEKSVKYSEDLADGTYREFYTTGQIKIEVKDGVDRRYDEKGRLRVEIKNGKARLWNAKGQEVKSYDEAFPDNEGFDETYNQAVPRNISDEQVTEIYNQIGSKRKAEMDKALITHRTDLTPEQRKAAIDEIEKLGEQVKEGGTPKHEKAAIKWLIGGHIRLPEDNYKIIDAIKISEQQHFDPMQYDDPNEILAKYTIKETRAERRINPDTVKAFSNKVDYGNGITVYTVMDNGIGQAAVRKIIDTHWGENANPWCLASRKNDYDTRNMWKYYSTTEKRIAFKDGKLLAFSASDTGEVQWWDREDQPTAGIPYTVKNKESTIDYILDENTGKSIKVHEKLSNGTERTFDVFEQLVREKLPDGTERFYRNGKLYQEVLPNGNERYFDENEKLVREITQEERIFEEIDNYFGGIDMDHEDEFELPANIQNFLFEDNAETYNQSMPSNAPELNAKEQLDAIRKQYEGTKQWLKAPNGKKSKLTEKQWLQVRTPNFKRWFGNWIYNPDEKVTVTDINNIKIPFNWKDTKDVKQWLRNNLAGREVSINSDGVIVGFTGRGLGDSLKGRGEEQRTAYTRLDELVKNAVFFDFRKVDDQIKHEHLKGQDLYYSAMKFKNDIYPVQIILDVNKESLRNTYKGHKVIKDIKVSPAVSMAETTSGIPSQSGDTLALTLADLTNGVKPENVSKVLDENGEPLVVYHGTPNPGFSVFNTHDWLGRNTGAWFSDSRDTSDTYTHANFDSEYDENTYETYLNIKNPLIIDYEGGGSLDDEYNGGLQEPAYYLQNSDGYDGVIAKNVKDRGDFLGGAAERNEDGNLLYFYEDTMYGVKNPEQIKSATKNNGNFDPSNPDIYYQPVLTNVGTYGNINAYGDRKKRTISRRSFLDWLRGSNIDKRSLHVPSVDSEPSSDNLRFENEATERRYAAAEKGIQQPTLVQRIRNSTDNILRSFRSPFAELSSKKDLLKAKNLLEQLGRNQSAKVNDSMKSFTDNLGALTPNQRNLFARKRLLDDLMWRKSQLPDAELPFGFNEDMLKREYDRFTELASKNKTVMNAIKAEERTMQKISDEFASLAKDLGVNLDNVFKNPHYYRHTILEYANAAAMGNKKGKENSASISGTNSNSNSIQGLIDEKLNDIKNRNFLKHYKGSSLDISTNYIQANGEVRTQMLMDIEMMKTLKEIKKHYDKAPQLRERLHQLFTPKGQSETHNQGEGLTLSDVIPDGYSLYNPAGSRLIQSANTATENVIAMALDDASDASGLPLDEILISIGTKGEELLNQLWIIPTELKESLRKMAKGRDRGVLGNSAKVLTNWWKKAVLFNPTRNLKYNFRNFTGDLDTVIAGRPDALRYFGQAVKELTAMYRGKEATQDLKDYIERSGGLNIESMQLSEKDLKILQNFAETTSKNPLVKGVKGSWNLIKKFFAAETALTQWREHLLRYAAYLSYKQDMDKHNGTPSTWGASIKDEIMALDDNRDKAFKLSNELLGDYENISDFGKALREFAIPFWSWSEMNAKRYYRLLKNGFSGDNSSDFTKRLLIGQGARMPFYALSAAETFGKVALFTMLVQAFNRFFFPDDDDELPEDVKYRPHLTLGKVNGKVYYFDRIGALADNLDWLNLDSIFLDAKQMANGQLPLGTYLKKMVQAPVSKVLNSLNPLITMPIELATGRSMYPDAFNPKTIKDNGKYLASSLGLTWPYKAITGEPRNDYDELSNLLLYSIDPDEAAYWQTLDKVRQFQNRILDKHFDGFASTKRGQVLQKLKMALRYNDRAAVRRYLREYAKLDGTKKGLKQSMLAMDPLHGLSKDEKKKFMKWITADDRKYLRKAERYYHKLADKYTK